MNCRSNATQKLYDYVKQSLFEEQKQNNFRIILVNYLLHFNEQTSVGIKMYVIIDCNDTLTCGLANGNRVTDIKKI